MNELYTQGGEYVLPDLKTIYVGPYSISPEGRIQSNTGNQIMSEILYPITIKDDQIITHPIYDPEIPNNNDIELGYFIRYFVKYKELFKYIEISKNTYNKIQNQDETIAWELYDHISIPWIIKGETSSTYNSNESTIKKIEKENKWFGISHYLKNGYLKFHNPL